MSVSAPTLRTRGSVASSRWLLTAIIAAAIVVGALLASTAFRTSSPPVFPPAHRAPRPTAPVEQPPQSNITFRPVSGFHPQ